jgi:hypothetical protein
MWVIEINFAGRRFTHHVQAPRRSMLRFGPRSVGWRSAQLRNPHAA